ncbi:MAG: HNH endonuclease family protein, partial [Mycoplasma sp.]
SIWKNEKINNMETLKKSLSEISNYFYIYSCIRGKEYLEKGNFLYKYKLYLENLDEKEAHYSLFINLINESCEWNDSIDGLMIPTIKFENQKLLLDFFKLVEKYLIRLHVSKGTGISTGSFFDSFISNDIKDSYNKLYEEIKNMTQNHIFGFSPLNDFAQKLKSNSLPPTAAKSMIRKIAHLDGKNYDYNSLEHIIPKENKLWKDFFKSKKIENEESFNKKSEENVDKLGNLLIIDSESNTKASNKLFEEKIKIYPSCYLVNGKKENSCEELMNLLEKNNFCFDDVIKRTEQLVKILVTENYYKFDFEDDYCDCESNEESSFLYN